MKIILIVQAIEETLIRAAEMERRKIFQRPR